MDCRIDGCPKHGIARGLCHGHYKRWQRGDPLDSLLKVLKGDPLERFMLHVRKEESGCWTWTAYIMKQQRQGRTYARFAFGGAVLAHRWIYEHVVGPIPEGLELDHTCRVMGCVNPEHLEPVTRKENIARALPFRKKRAHCPQGHAYEGENIRYNSKGYQICHACTLRHYRNYHARKRATA